MITSLPIPRFPAGQPLVLLLLLGLVLAASGCSMIYPESAKAKLPKADYVPANHVGDAVLPARLRRVVLMPLAGGEAAPAESCAALDAIVIESLQRMNRFEVVPLSREACRTHFGVEELSSVMALPTDFMAVLKRDYAADAVLFVDVTVYHAYIPLSVGLRAKLALIGEDRLVWSFDNLYSTDDPLVAASASRYLQGREPVILPAELETVTLESPERFATYAISSMFTTLPPVKAVAGAVVAATATDSRKAARVH